MYTRKSERKKMKGKETKQIERERWWRAVLEAEKEEGIKRE